MGAAADRWVASGLAALTGRPDGPALRPPVDALLAFAGDDLPLLTERAALHGWTRQGTTSCGGGTRLLRTADGWLAVNLARPDDQALVPAWLTAASDAAETTVEAGGGGPAAGSAEGAGGGATVVGAAEGAGAGATAGGVTVEAGVGRPAVGLAEGAGSGARAVGAAEGAHGPTADGPTDAGGGPTAAGPAEAGGAGLAVGSGALAGGVGTAAGTTAGRLAGAPDVWAEVTSSALGMPGGVLEAVGAELGLAVAVVPDSPPAGEAVVRTRLGDAAPLERAPLVVDLSSLWAGPLCSRLLLAGGARVVKVESTSRPDGARADTTGFFDLLNHGKASVALDLPSTYGLAQLRRLLAAADVVIEGSRPRVLRQWGIDPLTLPEGPQVWASITGHGRDVDRVAFGDDAAAAGGLVAWEADGPVFLADAIADPLAGIAAHRAVVAALAEGGCWLLDVALARVAASLAVARTEVSPVDGPAPPPTARPIPGPAAELGADTAAVLAEL